MSCCCLSNCFVSAPKLVFNPDANAVSFTFTTTVTCTCKDLNNDGSTCLGDCTVTYGGLSVSLDDWGGPTEIGGTTPITQTVDCSYEPGLAGATTVTFTTKYTTPTLGTPLVFTSDQYNWMINGLSSPPGGCGCDDLSGGGDQTGGFTIYNPSIGGTNVFTPNLTTGGGTGGD